MFKKLMVPMLAAIAILFGLQAPASAAMSIAKPAAASPAAAQDVIVVRGRRGGFRGRGFRRHRFRHHGFRHHRRHRWHRRWHRRRHYYGGRWAAYRRCVWKQRRGYRIYCPYPGYY